jgi:hypothetical protein
MSSAKEVEEVEMVALALDMDPRYRHLFLRMEKWCWDVGP